MSVLIADAALAADAAGYLYVAPHAHARAYSGYTGSAAASAASAAENQIIATITPQRIGVARSNSRSSHA
jgi:hypothetical protein